MTIKKSLALTIAAGAIALGASTVVMAAPAAAHTPEASATCSTLTVALENYSVGTNGAMVNSVSVEIDSEVIDETRFGSSLHETYPLGDTAVAHEYVVEIDASGTQYDRDFTGTSVPCKQAAVADADAALTVTPATCDTNGGLVLGEPVNSSWDTPSAVTGPAQYTATATADAGHVFADGSATKSFTGILAGMLDSAQPTCAAIVPDRPAPVRNVTDETTLDCDSVTRTTTTTTTTTDWALEQGTNTWVVTPAVITTATATVVAAPGLCPPPVVPTPPTAVVTPLTPAATPLVPDGLAPSAAATVAPTPSDVADTNEPTVEVLASTGSNAAMVAPIGAAILLCGGALLLARRFAARGDATRD
ncbi:hypothetical protein GCM10027413_06130 [Conyzicola nivalis]|uniref:LPXTG-motif cell wall anchor domain-containing protein n=1 Tax=Conyzicola nivalis TaxID=1477021 RepID=A0A916WK58_9MICO|nr:hypothetical protein [Conyzicola nivalis]GGB05712.1 hypothetical protein GCM10010979_20500 [Conyzicola nivalis]